MYAYWMNSIRQTGSRGVFADASAHRLISDLCGLIDSPKGHKIIAAGDLNILYGYMVNMAAFIGKRGMTLFLKGSKHWVYVLSDPRHLKADGRQIPGLMSYQRETKMCLISRAADKVPGQRPGSWILHLLQRALPTGLK